MHIPIDKEKLMYGLEVIFLLTSEQKILFPDVYTV